MRHSRVESLGSPSKMDELHKQYLRQQFQQNIVKFPILRKIQQEVHNLQKIENDGQFSSIHKPNSLNSSTDMWYNNQEMEILKPTDLQILIDKVTTTIVTQIPNLIDQFKQFNAHNQISLNMHQTSHSETLTEQCQSQYKAALKFIMQLLIYRGIKRPEQSISTQQQEIVSVDIQRKHSLVSIIKDKPDKNLQRKINELSIQNHKLGMEVKQLSSKLRSFELNQDIIALKSQIEELTLSSLNEISRLTTINEAKEKQIMKNNQLTVQLKAIILKLETQINALQQYIDDTKANYTMMESTYNSLSEDRYYWRDLAQMQREDLDSQNQRFGRYVNEEAKSKRKLLTLQSEIDKIKIEKSKVIQLPEVNKDAEEKLIKLTYLFNQDKYYYVQMKDLVLQKVSSINEQEQYFYTMLKNLKFDYNFHDNLQKYTYPRQSFLIFYENQMKMIENEYKNIEHHKIQLTYFATIRAILDSKYNEFQFVENTQICSKFADFVHSWISTFNIDKTTRRIVFHKDKNQTILDNLRMDFLLDILNPKFSRINECITFNEFLFEQGSLDELYYYLYCRQILFKGNLSNQSRYSFETIMYVRLKDAEQIVDIVMSKYDPNNVNQVKLTIRDQVVIKAKQQLIDGHYVLRIFLELYRQERRNRLNMLREMFHACVQLQSTGKYGVNYRNFRKIFQFNFPNASEVEICQLFRESHMCGDGNVSAESFFTAATESNFFIKQLQLKTPYNTPIIELQKISYCEQNLPFLDFFSNYNSIPHQLLSDLCIEFGLEPIYYYLERVKQYVEGQLSDQFQIQSIIQLLANLLSTYHKLIVMKINQQTILTGEMGNLEIDALKTMLQNISQIFQPLQILDQQHKLLQITMNSKLRQVQMAGKRKAQKFYALLSALLSTKLNQQKDKSPKRGSMEDMSPKRKFQRQGSVKQF